jgi:hypothetical protein
VTPGIWGQWAGRSRKRYDTSRSSGNDSRAPVPRPPSGCSGTTAAGSRCGTAPAAQSPDRCAGHRPVGPAPRSPPPRRDRARLGVPVAHHQPMPALVPLTGRAGQVRVDLGLQRRGQHSPGTLSHDLIQHAANLAPRLVGHYAQHRRHLPHRRQRRCSLACSAKKVRCALDQVADPQVQVITTSRFDGNRGAQHVSERFQSAASASAGSLRPSR